MRWIWVILGIASTFLAACGGGGDDGACSEGETRPCYTGPAGTENVGECKPGVETCVDGQFTGICIGDVTPFVEHCDGLDEDCSGTVDDVAEAGATCTSADGCEGATACVGADLGCVAPKRNACDVCGGTAVTDVGLACTVTTGAITCDGSLVCNLAGDGTDCDAPAPNECGLCGGPPVAGLTDDCTATSGCAGIKVCNADNDGAICDCNPEPGMCRDGGTFRPVVAPTIGDLVITELLPNPAGEDNFEEWFEVEVLADVDLNQLELDRAGDTLAANVIASVDCIRVTAGTRLVFARDADPALNGGLPPIAGTFSFSLITGTAASPGDIRLVSAGTVIDAVTWTSSPAAAALQLDPRRLDEIQNDDQGNFCAATAAYGTAGNRGTPGAANAQCLFAGECTDNGTNRAIVKPAPGQLVITEALPQPAGADGDEEWFEIANTGGTAFDLNGLGLKGNATTVNTITQASCVTVAPGGFAVFAHTTDPVVNGGLTVAATFTFALADSNGSARVLDGATELDAVTWPSSTAGASRQLDVNDTTTTANDDTNNFCNGTATYGATTNRGTPGVINEVCPPGVGECRDGGANRAIVKPVAGQLVITEFLADTAGAGNDGTQEWFEITNAGATSFDLNDLGLKGNGTGVSLISSSACKPLAPGGFALFAHLTDPAQNGGLPAVDATFSFALAASAGSISVLDGATVVDAVTWPASIDGASSQLDPTKTTATDNDDPLNFCPAKVGQQYGTAANLGTPKVANVCL